MPQNKEVHKEYMRGYRSNRKRGIITKGELMAPSKPGEPSIPDVIPEGSQKGSQVHPAILRAIIDPKIRSKVEKISQELNSRGLGRDVRYGIDGPTFDIVAQLLEVTK